MMSSERPRADRADVPERTQAQTLQSKELVVGETPRPDLREQIEQLDVYGIERQAGWFVKKSDVLALLASSPVVTPSEQVVAMACQTPNCSKRGIPTRVGVCPACAVNTKQLPRNPVADLLASPVVVETPRYDVCPNCGVVHPCQIHPAALAETPPAPLKE